MAIQIQSQRFLLIECITLLLADLGDTFAADEGNTLTPADISSPCSTLSGFIATLDRARARLIGIIKSYQSSSRVYFSEAERVGVDRVYDQIELARRTLNLSELPVALTRTDSLSRNHILQLEELLDRLELPAFESIPNAAAM